MANTTRPQSYTNWTDGADNKVSQPPAALLSSGFGAGQPIAYQHLNWLFYSLDQWVQFLDGSINATLMATTLDTATRLSGGGTLGYVQSSGTLSWSDTLYINIPTILPAVNAIPAGSVAASPGQYLYVVANVPFTTQGDITQGAQTVQNLAFEKGIVVGQSVTGPSFASGTTVSAISGTTLTLSTPAVASAAQGNLTFTSSGNLTVNAANVQSLIPTANTIILGRVQAQGTAIFLGINAVETILRDGEKKTLSTTGYTGVVPMVAGAALSALQVVYTSSGTADGRTAGSVYPADAGFANFAMRGRVLGVAPTAAASGASTSVVTQGVVGGFSGLTPGASYFVDPTTPGGITLTKAGAAIEVGVAISTSALFLRHSRAVLGLDPQINSLTIAPISGDPTAAQVYLTDASGNKLFGADALGNGLATNMALGAGSLANLGLKVGNEVSGLFAAAGALNAVVSGVLASTLDNAGGQKLVGKSTAAAFANPAATFTVDTAGNLAAASLKSGRGFRDTFGPGFINSGTAPAQGSAPLQLRDGSGLSFLAIPTANGSLVGLTLYYANGTTTPLVLYLLRDAVQGAGAMSVTGPSTVVVPGATVQNSVGVASFAKGTYKVSAGDMLYFGVGSGSSSSLNVASRVLAYATFEADA